MHIPDGFSITEFEACGKKLRLVSPEKMFRWSAQSDLKLRSVVLDENDNVVSSGFPKFFNYFESEALRKIAKKCFRSKQFVITPKLDGSLIIRAVINGTVHWRTRGNTQLGDFEVPVMKLVEQYPILQSPQFAPFESLLFEYTALENRIVLKYPEASLVLIGIVDNKTLNISRYDEVENLRATIGMPALEKISTSFNNSEDYNEFVLKQVGIEGYVVYFYHDDKVTLCKFKTEDYMIKHTLRTNLTDKYIKSLLYNTSAQTFPELEEVLYSRGYDAEDIEIIRPYWITYITRYKQATDMINKMRSVLEKHTEVNRESIVCIKQNFIEHESVAFHVLKRDQEWLDDYTNAYALDAKLVQYRNNIKKR